MTGLQEKQLNFAAAAFNCSAIDVISVHAFGSPSFNDPNCAPSYLNGAVEGNNTQYKTNKLMMMEEFGVP